MNTGYFLSCASIVLLSGCASEVAPPEMPGAYGLPVLESWQAAFAPCVSPFGVGGNLPIIGETAAAEFTGESVQLSEPGIVSDGYYHLLVLNRARTEAIIVQTGGFANLTTSYGPLKLKAGCAAPRVSSANRSVNADAQSRSAATPRRSLVAGYVRR